MSGALSTRGLDKRFGSLVVARDQFSGNTPQFWYFWIGALLIMVVMFLPNGILGGLKQITASARWPRWMRPP